MREVELTTYVKVLKLLKLEEGICAHAFQMMKEIRDN